MCGKAKVAVVLTAILLVCSACGGTSDHDQYPNEYGENGEWIYGNESDLFDQLAQDRGFDSYEEMEAYDNRRGGETYDEYDSRRDRYGGAYGEFEGYGCTVDCSGHEAGYAWAQDRGIDDPDDCGGKSWSFEEGCRAYAEENGY